MITVKMMDLFGKDEAFAELDKITLTGKVAFAVARLKKAVQQELETFYASRLEVAKRYADRDEKGEIKVDENGNIHIPEDKMEECNKELTEVLQEEVELNANYLKAEWFENIELPTKLAGELLVFVEG